MHFVLNWWCTQRQHIKCACIFALCKLCMKFSCPHFHAAPFLALFCCLFHLSNLFGLLFYFISSSTFIAEFIVSVRFNSSKWILILSFSHSFFFYVVLSSFSVWDVLVLHNLHLYIVLFGSALALFTYANIIFFFFFFRSIISICQPRHRRVMSCKRNLMKPVTRTHSPVQMQWKLLKEWEKARCLGARCYTKLFIMCLMRAREKRSDVKATGYMRATTNGLANILKWQLERND